MCEFVIRPPEEKDIPALRDLYLETRKSTFDWLHSETMALQDFDRDTQGERILCAYFKEKPVGFLSYWEADRFIPLFICPPLFSEKGNWATAFDAGSTAIWNPAYFKMSETKSFRPALLPFSGMADRRAGNLRGWSLVPAAIW